MPLERGGGLRPCSIDTPCLEHPPAVPTAPTAGGRERAGLYPASSSCLARPQSTTLLGPVLGLLRLPLCLSAPRAPLVLGIKRGGRGGWQHVPSPIVPLPTAWLRATPCVSQSCAPRALTRALRREGEALQPRSR